MNNAVQLYRSDDAQQNLILAGRRDPHAPESRLDLQSLLGMLRRRRTLFLAVMLSILALGVVLTVLATPIYTATATVVIDTSRLQLAPANEQILSGGDPSAALVDTEVQVIMSNELASRVDDALHLDQLARFDPATAAPGRRALLWSKLTGKPVPIPQRAYDAQAQREYVLGILESGLKVVRTGTTYALTISFSSGDPVFSAAVANEYGKQYTQLALQRKRAANTRATDLLTSRLPGLREKAQADTLALQQYRVANNLLSTNASQLTEQEVSTYNQEVASARAAAAEDRARLATARQQLRSGSKGDDVGEALSSGVVSSLRTQRAGLASQLADLTTRYGPKHPDVQRVQHQIDQIDASIQEEINRVISNLQAKTNVSGDRLGSIQGSLSGARGTLATSNRALVGFADLSRKAAASEAQYEAYLARLTQAQAQEGTEQADARVITWADVPASPSSPIIWLNLLLAAMLGLGAGITAAFMTELAFHGLTTGEEIEARLGIPFLGSVPLLKSVLKYKGSPADAVVEHPHSAFAEACRSLQTSISYSADAVMQVVAVTSALPQEGKSTLAACLARVAAIDGESVLLVDCDQRRKSVSKLVVEPRQAGLLDVLRGEAQVADALVRDEASGAWLLPINREQMVPGDYFSGPAFRELLDQLREQFSYIVLDTAPLLPIADARVIATLADATVLVARWRKTTDHAIRNALRLLPRGRIHLAGVVLSQVNVRKQARFGFGDPTYYYNQYKEYFS